MGKYKERIIKSKGRKNNERRGNFLLGKCSKIGN